MAKKRLNQSLSARLMRRAVAYDRLAAKASRAGNRAAWNVYFKQSSDLKNRAMRARERGQ